jgi:hypothetical protein
MHAVESLISAQFLVMGFHYNYLAKQTVATDSIVTTLGCNLREDLLWLSDFCSGTPDDALGHSSCSSDYSKAVRILSCSPERANGILFWQCFEKPNQMQRWVIFSKKYSQDMLSQYVPEHHDGRTPLQLSAVNLACALVFDLPDLPQNPETMIVLIIESGADLHEAHQCCTPLQLFLNTIEDLRLRDYNSFVVRPWNMLNMLKEWLNILERAGVDLNEYGAEKSRRLHAKRFAEEPKSALQAWDGLYRWHQSRVESSFIISYGPTPQDWTVQLDMAEQYAGDFWRMPGLLSETEVQVIPGSWIDT